ncbi:DNA-binding transcriptional ArsR family regulator [Methanomicrobium sp. W14]|uniref:ArsR/SmtB family transcription factor n=1 Tax=Methanomicrobium sp. W14 TaxID=2817839 RepID=UPI001AE19347|nr:winged helix-turn-helix domain-containing protein [Methanomicrobium sp. W14]MBP2134134.1 DNA-binding transcriptional ArsR family regulator [Methanomicrobium sp. W14]
MDKKSIVLNKDIFEILSCDTRIDILKSLNSRRKTNSEISKELSLRSSTIHRHLEKLEETGLIKSIDSENKWVYYELTPAGDALINPNKNNNFIIYLSSLLTYITTIAALYTYYTIPRLNSKSLFPLLIEDPFCVLFAVCISAIILQTIIILVFYFKNRTLI